LNEKQQSLLDGEAETCQGKIGMAPITDDQLQTVIDQQADRQNFNPNCMANNKLKKRRTCDLYCEGTEINNLPAKIGVDSDIVSLLL